MFAGFEEARPLPSAESPPPMWRQGGDVPPSAGPGVAWPDPRAGARARAFPSARLSGLPVPLRTALRGQGIATCVRLLEAAGDAAARARLAREADIDPGALLALVRRADLARVDKVGPAFGTMLEDLGVRDAWALAVQEPGSLHARLCAHHRSERLTRRAPMLREVEGWIDQARRLPPLVGY